MHLDTEELAMYAEAVIAEMGGVRPAARAYGIANSGNVTHARKGNDSPACRRAWKIPKHPPRHRLIINCPPATIARFHEQRGDATMGECLDKLMDRAEGIAPLEY